MVDKLALVADQDTILGFGTLGMDCFTAENSQAVKEAMKTIREQKYAVLFITDEAADLLGDELPAFMKKLLMMKIPSCRSRKKMGLETITAIVEKAVGIANIMDKA